MNPIIKSFSLTKESFGGTIIYLGSLFSGIIFHFLCPGKTHIELSPRVSWDYPDN